MAAAPITAAPLGPLTLRVLVLGMVLVLGVALLTTATGADTLIVALVLATAELAPPLTAPAKAVAVAVAAALVMAVVALAAAAALTFCDLTAATVLAASEAVRVLLASDGRFGRR